MPLSFFSKESLRLIRLFLSNYISDKSCLHPKALYLRRSFQIEFKTSSLLLLPKCSAMQNLHCLPNKPADSVGRVIWMRLTLNSAPASAARSEASAHSCSMPLASGKFIKIKVYELLAKKAWNGFEGVITFNLTSFWKSNFQKEREREECALCVQNDQTGCHLRIGDEASRL